jgi:hypothetical protein
MIRTVAAILLLLLCGLAAAGCRHPCGYVGKHTAIVPEADAGLAESRPAPDPLVIEQLLAPGSGTLVLRAEGLEVASAMAECRLYGREAYVEYRWYTPLVKPLVVLTLVGPFYAAGFDPHAHDGGNWDLLDYLRDVGAWFNLFSGIPTGARLLADEETLLRSERRMTVVRVARVALADRKVALFIDDKPFAEARTDSVGRARFELDPWVRARTDSADHALRLELDGAAHGALSVTLRNAAVVQYLNERDKVLPIR